MPKGKSFLREATRQVDRFSRSFAKRVDQVREFHEANGRYPDPAEGSVGLWVSLVRKDWESYPEDRGGVRARLLESLPEWSWDGYRESQRDPFIQKLTDWYLSTDGIADPSTGIVEQAELSYWMHRNRKQYATGKMAESRVAEMESIPFWTWETRNYSLDPKRSLVECEISWMIDNAVEGRARTSGVTGYSGARHQCDIVLEDYKVIIEHDGRLWHADYQLIDAEKTADLENAGWTVLRIREAPLEHIAGISVHVSQGASMTETFIAVRGALLKLGVQVSDIDLDALGKVRGGRLPHYDDWFSSFEAFQSYIEDGGSSTPIATAEAGEFKVGQWVGVQRRNLKRGKLPESKKSLLEAIPGWQWELKPQVKLGWDESYRRLLEYQSENNKMPAAKFRYPDGFKLGSWAAYQRYAFRKGELSAGRIELLDQVPEWYWEK